MNKLASFVIIILLVCGGALWFLANGSLDDFIKQQIETQGSKITNQTVLVRNVEMKLIKGSGAINGFSLSNPEKYKYPHAFSFETILLDINIKSLTEDPIVIDEIRINNPQAFVELAQSGSANLSDILDDIEKNLPKSEAEAQQPESSSQKEPNIRVSKLILAGTNLSLDLSALGNKEHQITLPDINLTNIGGDKGLPASLLGAEIAKQALSSIWKQAKAEQKEKLKDKIKNKLKEKALDKLGSFLN
ncbi:hypothetical protein [Colwellia sp. UCD-KL20]|uniref:DUF748 domain-containing protein n=1 Tax=Colwellia sp. UCD-KL20 TaxID=1917165 RepID=UPI0009704C9D|nr:hypothetical protein [Colwellia sp. UCD-KL20]